MTATAPEASGDTADRPAVAPVATARLNRLGTVPGPTPAPEGAPPSLRDFLGSFLGSEETRLRDLLAFGLAVQAGKPPGPDGIDALRRKADADLNDHAFRLLHNQVAEIRRQAVEEEAARQPRRFGFFRAVLANLVALAIAGLVVLALLAMDPGLPAELAGQAARLLSTINGGG
ncbi:hypothetical protein [Roseomonas sp. AR75]|uniref:hypothetical protein n=1 Tax=Roseomonas sp. AR75 TaxID=2562311 RepID=UPI0010C05788|nr:hypothetical protein [Roseomonas sp. AR75]